MGKEMNKITRYVTDTFLTMIISFVCDITPFIEILRLLQLLCFHPAFQRWITFIYVTRNSLIKPKAVLCAPNIVTKEKNPLNLRSRMISARFFSLDRVCIPLNYATIRAHVPNKEENLISKCYNARDERGNSKEFFEFTRLPTPNFSACFQGLFG